jgi:GTP-binding protein EngB required for normal cell division
MLDSPDGMDLRGLLDAGANCLAQIWPEGHPALRGLNTLHKRLEESLLQVAILGQFKRGKSTFINALLGASLLPSAVVPTTAIPTFIAWGPKSHLRITYQDSQPPEDVHPADSDAIRRELYQWVTEDGNPLNRRRVHRVDLFFPADVLRDGIVLIDTPGIGSTLRHNTDAALEVLPECDAALFVVSADPPVTEAEISYLRAVRPHVTQLYFVLNKIDYLNSAEQQQAIGFLRKAFRDALGSAKEPEIFPLSARGALQDAAEARPIAPDASGLFRIEREILHPLSSSKRNALRDSASVKVRMLLEQGLADLSLKIRALELPLDDLEHRARALSEALRESERERLVAHDTLEGDKRRAIAELERQAEALRQEAGCTFDSLVQRNIEANHGIVRREEIQHSLDTAIPGFFEARLKEFAAEFHQLVETILARHQQRADVLIVSVRAITASLFDVALPPQEPPEPFRLGPEPYWVSQRLVHALIPSPASLLRRVLPGAMRQTYLRRTLEQEIAGLILQNVEGLRWSTLRGLETTFRRFAKQFDDHLAEAIAATEGSVGQVINRRRHEAARAAAELECLRTAQDCLRSIIAGLAHRPGEAPGPVRRVHGTAIKRT